MHCQGDVPSSSDEPMMPRLSCSQRTTAPAMATDPCKHTQSASSAKHLHHLPALLFSRRLLHLQRVAGRLVPAQFVGHGGQQAVVRHHWLKEKNKQRLQRTDKVVHEGERERRE